MGEATLYGYLDTLKISTVPSLQDQVTEQWLQRHPEAGASDPRSSHVQGCLAHKKTPSPKSLL